MEEMDSLSVDCDMLHPFVGPLGLYVVDGPIAGRAGCVGASSADLNVVVGCDR